MPKFAPCLHPVFAPQNICKALYISAMLRLTDANLHPIPLNKPKSRFGNVLK